ncbi:hypothetical protein VPH35_112548 [Triticum aestivum]
MQGMSLAIQHCELPLIVQSNSFVALSALSGDSLSRSAYGHLVVEIRHLMVDRVSIPSKISRVQNRVADRLALYSRTERTTVVWLGRGPPCIEDLRKARRRRLPEDGIKHDDFPTVYYNKLCLAPATEGR